MKRKISNIWVALAVCIPLAGMITIASYSVTLYRLFCSATGANGTTRRATAAPDERGRFITVLFDTTVSPALPWRFVPLQRRVRLRLGEETIAYFEAENISDHDIVGRATFNVTPEKTGVYFKKIQCFCFNEQMLHAHQKVSMPVTFFVDPALDRDPNTNDINEITLAYTFFRSTKPDQAVQLGNINVVPAIATGEKIFGAQCAGCHELDRDKIGPRLAGVFGRMAGSVAGYPYSAGLKSANFAWDTKTLNTWLSGPQAMIAGAAMPMQMQDAQDRAAVLAYLRTLKAE